MGGEKKRILFPNIADHIMGTEADAAQRRTAERTGTQSVEREVLHDAKKEYIQ